MNRSTWVFFIAAILTTPPGFTAGAGQRPRPVLEGVPELQKRVTYSETKITLGELV